MPKRRPTPASQGSADPPEHLRDRAQGAPHAPDEHRLGQHPPRER